MNPSPPSRLPVDFPDLHLFLESDAQFAAGMPVEDTLCPFQTIRALGKAFRLDALVQRQEFAPGLQGDESWNSGLTFSVLGSAQGPVAWASGFGNSYAGCRGGGAFFGRWLF